MPAIHRTLTISPRDGGTVSLTDSASTTGSFVMGFAAGGLIYRATGGTAGAVTISFHVDPLDNGTRYQLYDGAGAAVTVQVAASQCIALPDALFAAGRVYLVLNTGQTATVRIGEKS